ncbi:MAG: transposase, partial [Thermomicrobiales bacterium]|nr:transposase [Thermomicrobiales bacterium]
DCLDGEHHGFTGGLTQRGVPDVVALRPSHAWWAPVEAIGAGWEVAATGGWGSAEQPGAWAPRERHDRDGHREIWWALAGVAGPYGPDRGRRRVVATADPAPLPDPATWDLETTLPHQQADLAAVVRLSGLRTWVEQHSKQLKTSRGWSQYQGRADVAIRRHWTLVPCAFAFCWWAETPALPPDTTGPEPRQRGANDPSGARGGKRWRTGIRRGPGRGAAGRGRCGGCGPGWNRRCCCGAAGPPGAPSRRRRGKPSSPGCPRAGRSSAMTPRETCPQSTAVLCGVRRISLAQR